MREMELERSRWHQAHPARHHRRTLRSLNWPSEPRIYTRELRACPIHTYLLQAGATSQLCSLHFLSLAQPPGDRGEQEGDAGLMHSPFSTSNSPSIIAMTLRPQNFGPPAPLLPHACLRLNPRCSSSLAPPWVPAV